MGSGGMGSRAVPGPVGALGCSSLSRAPCPWPPPCGASPAPAGPPVLLLCHQSVYPPTYTTTAQSDNSSGCSFPSVLCVGHCAGHSTPAGPSVCRRAAEATPELLWGSGVWRLPDAPSVFHLSPQVTAPHCCPACTGPGTSREPIKCSWHEYLWSIYYMPGLACTCDSSLSHSTGSGTEARSRPRLRGACLSSRQPLW